MTLYDSLPECVTAGRKYRLDLDFRNVLRMLDILSDETLIEESRMYLALRCVMRHVPGRMSKQIKLFAAVTGLLFGDAKHGEQHETYMSLTQDAELIIGAFRQAYGINLYTDKLHWFEFRTLLACLPEGSRYSEVVDIRAKPLPKPTKWNGEERMALLKAKHSVALQRTDRQTRESYTASVYRVADSLKAIAKRGEGH
jgi:hypothetical protein